MERSALEKILPKIVECDGHRYSEMCKRCHYYGGYNRARKEIIDPLVKANVGVVPSKEDIMKKMGWRETLHIQGISLNNQVEVFDFYADKATAVRSLMLGKG